MVQEDHPAGFLLGSSSSSSSIIMCTA